MYKLKEDELNNMVTYTPTNYSTECILESSRAGSFDELLNIHRQKKGCFEKKSYKRPPVHRSNNNLYYGKENNSLFEMYKIFDLLKEDGENYYFLMRDSIRFAKNLRDVLADVAIKNRLFVNNYEEIGKEKAYEIIQDIINSFIKGHNNGEFEHVPHMAIIPLPSICPRGSGRYDVSFGKKVLIGLFKNDATEQNKKYFKEVCNCLDEYEYKNKLNDDVIYFKKSEFNFKNFGSLKSLNPIVLKSHIRKNENTDDLKYRKRVYKNLKKELINLNISEQNISSIEVYGDDIYFKHDEISDKCYTHINLEMKINIDDLFVGGIHKYYGGGLMLRF